MVIVEVPLALSEAGLKPALAPLGSPDADRFTVCDVPDSVIVIVEVVEPPGFTLPEDGLSEIVKSLPPPPVQPGNWKEASRVFQLKPPVDGSYSLVYQNVQSSA